MYLGYLSINLLILPTLKKISFNDFEKLLTINIIKTILAIVVVSYLLAIGVNTISYYAKPHLFNYGDYQFLSFFGYNDKPLTDLFFGFDRAIVLLIISVAFAGLRELIIWVINKPGAKRGFRVLLTNNITPLVSFIF
ncbi:MAG: hypothetical protein WKI04_07595 [Ferruginibacter sp.]